MKYRLFCGGTFCFDYQEGGYESMGFTDDSLIEDDPTQGTLVMLNRLKH